MPKRRAVCLRAVAGALALALAAFSLAGCGAGEEEATPAPQETTRVTPSPAATAATPTTVARPTAAITPAETPQPGAAAVTIRDFEFEPDTVTIRAGGTVTWMNEGPSTHTVSADDGSFESGDLARGATFSYTFEQPGTYSYHCKPHPFMRARVVVE